MAEAALRSCGEEAATPRKRSREELGWEFCTPVSKRPPAGNSGNSGNSRRLELPEEGIPGNAELPAAAFYGKRRNPDPLERSRIRELLGQLGSGRNSDGNPGNSGRNPGNSDGNSGKSFGNNGKNLGNSKRHSGRNGGSSGRKFGNSGRKFGNSGKNLRNSSKNLGNSGRNLGNSGRSLGNSGRHLGNSGRNLGNSGRDSGNSGKNLGNSSKNLENSGKILGNSGRNLGNSGGNLGNSGSKAKQEDPKGSSGGGDLGNSQIPAAGNSGNSGNSGFRVLSSGVRPALRPLLGAAFFQSGKRSRKKSRKEPGKENRECGQAEAGIAGNPGKSTREEQGSLGPRSSLSPQKEPGSAAPAGLFPIFLPARRRPLEELPAPLGPSGKAPRKSKESWNSQDQLIIDAGQQQLFPRQCNSCGLLFSPDSPEDRLQHLRHHRRLRDRLRHRGWKQERVVAEFWDGKIVLILPGDPKYALRKAQEVLELVDSELGFPGSGSGSLPGNSRVYLFVGSGNCVLGCLVAESIRQAFRVLPEPGLAPFPDPQDPQDPHDSRNSCDNSQDLNSQDENSREDVNSREENSQRNPAVSDPGSLALRAWRCSALPEPAVCGLSRLWVLRPRRRRGIARRMVDTLRRTFLFGAVLGSQDLAFSDPTPDGRGFAARYCGRGDFLVYNNLQPGAGAAPGSAGSEGSGSGSS